MRRPFALLLTAFIALGTAALASFQPTAEPTSSDVTDILVSRQLLESQDLAVGDLIDLAADPTGARARAFRIVGSYEPLPDPARFTQQRLEVRLHLQDMVDMLADPADPQSGESVSAINVALHDPEREREFRRSVFGQVPGLSVWSTQRGDSANPFVVLEQFHLAIAIVTILASTAFLLALMVMRSEERRETAGILRLIGLGKRRVLTQVLIEGVIIATVGAAFGIALALVAQSGFNQFFQWRYDTALVFVRVSPKVAAQCVALAVPLGVIASVVASWTLLRREVLALLRR
ncbi:MAG: ABC transporter permease [Vicinamibacterales bacterium]|jgi:ABC-type lipoprotein release transport system permease subunit|nr:hypothetical protein [Acidobacteriota bacterium]MDP7472029.1 ABC transporter permease [Vicinamibacterales bacterium]MDP7670339.1 ABC transporter permease [Vicinamibacterales bacterium]HJO37996.1 ABC transporter permease [Vicinamibacterales bacterium]|tara:strand:- start:1759 stop:2631 length:873 start_codon:yes stop_codon:yes gene_type:complete